MEIPVKAFILAFLTLTLSEPARAAVGYACGNSDRRQAFTYVHHNLKTLKAYVLSQCRALSDRPDLCTAPICQSYEVDSVAPAPRANRRAPDRRAPARRPAPRVHVPKDDCDAACWALRATEEAKRRQREDEIERMLRDYRDGKLNR
jgi:hypothetical protein